METKRIFSFLLAWLLLFSCVSLTVAAEKKQKVYTMAEIDGRAAKSNFGDTVGHWAEKAVNRFAAAGILTGDRESKRFRPDDPVSNAEFAMILSRLFRYQSKSAKKVADLTEDWYRDAVQQVLLAGVMSCDSRSRFRPYESVLREDAVVSLALAFGIPSVKNAALSYGDRKKVSSQAVGYIAAMTAEGYVRGDENGNFNPKDPLTRAECVTLLDNMVTAFFYEEGLYDYTAFTGYADYVIVGADNVTVKNFYIGENLILTEGVKSGSVKLKGCILLGNVKQYAKGGYTTLLKLSENILPINTKLKTSPYAPEKFERDSDNLMTYKDKNVKTYLGVDVSYHNGEMDWDALKKQGFYFAIIRCGYRGYSAGHITEDENFLENVKGALKAGLKVGVYFYSQAVNVNEATEEAVFVLDRIKGLDISFPVVFDWESHPDEDAARSTNVSSATVAAAAKRFCEKIKAAGYIPMVYTSSRDISVYYTPEFVADYYLWFASIIGLPPYYYHYDMWQYGAFSNDAAHGSHQIDMNISFVDFSKVKK